MRSNKRGAGKGAHIVSAWSKEDGVCLGQKAVEEKRNEIDSYFYFGKVPILRFGVSCEEQIYHLLSPKGGAKSVRRAKNSGTGRRLAPETLRGQARARVFDGASAARSSSRFFAMRSCCALRATMIICWCLFLAVLWPARMHCFRYFRSAIPQTRGLLKYN